MFHLFNHLLVLFLNSTTSMFRTLVPFQINMHHLCREFLRNTPRSGFQSLLLSQAKSLRRQFECAWRKNKKQLTRSRLRRQIATCNKIANRDKLNFYKNVISENKTIPENYGKSYTIYSAGLLKLNFHLTSQASLLLTGLLLFSLIKSKQSATNSLQLTLTQLLMKSLNQT